jgi:hypothetical protein
VDRDQVVAGSGRISVDLNAVVAAEMLQAVVAGEIALWTGCDLLTPAPDLAHDLEGPVLGERVRVGHPILLVERGAEGHEQPADLGYVEQSADLGFHLQIH